jgi:hypothetical protein
MRRSIVRMALGAVIAALFAGSVLVWAVNPSMPPSLYKPELKRELTQQARWQLDFELANEASMREHNSRRFDAPGSFEKRARWFEETAQWYPLADLMQQMINFRKSAMVNNEKAFNELVERGKQGDVGATCMAWMFYRHFRKEVTAKWHYSYDDVARAALKLKDSGHPVCSGVEGPLYLSGELGYPQDRSLAKPYMIGRAVTGFTGSQEYMANSHLFGSLNFEPKDVALQLCWERIADQTSPVIQFGTTCDAYRHGIAVDKNFQKVALPAHIQRLARDWCEPSRIVTAQTCADLELQTDGR